MRTSTILFIVYLVLALAGLACFGQMVWLLWTQPFTIGVIGKAFFYVIVGLAATVAGEFFFDESMSAATCELGADLREIINKKSEG